LFVLVLWTVQQTGQASLVWVQCHLSSLSSCFRQHPVCVGVRTLMFGKD
jgi:hypothetical protein